MEKYLAFISYRHIKPDEKVSARLRRFLESFHLPASCPIPKRRKCFRDTDELPTSTDLGADIENALKDSRYLIAVCSEEYVTSRWCMQEITRSTAQFSSASSAVPGQKPDLFLSRHRSITSTISPMNMVWGGTRE